MPLPGPQGSHRKSLAVRHIDAEPLTRADLQYDLLYYLFTDSQAVFTDPFPTINGHSAGSKVTFRDLYVNALVHSSRCSKVTKDKLLEAPKFGDEFAKISILSNVGRINTTMAFFPEMRTALRTYHPVPSLQKTDGNLQDAPRIKNILKSCYIDTERQNPPSTPAEILARSRSGDVPPTTIVNLLFVFAANASILTQTHFVPQSKYDILDFFCPINISSESRARALLWLFYHYLEAPSLNPFADEFALGNPGRIPKLETLSDEEMLLENVDPPDEQEWGEQMTKQRLLFMANKDQTPEDTREDDQLEQSKPKQKPKGPGKGSRKKREPKPTALPSNLTIPITASSSPMETSVPPDVDEEMIVDSSPLAEIPMIVSSPKLTIPSINTEHNTPSPGDTSQHRIHAESTPSSSRKRPRTPSNPYPLHLSPSATPTNQSTNGKPIRRARKPRESALPPPFQYSARELSSSHYGRREASRAAPTQHNYTRRVPSRTSLEHAWHLAMTADPLLDSDDEEIVDENTRSDLLLRLRIINRLRGKDPTPERDIVPPVRQPFRMS